MARKIIDMVALKLRMPEGLRKRLANEAEAAQRSLNSEILWRLGQTLDAKFQDFITGVEKLEQDRQEFIERTLQDPKVKEYLAKLIADMPQAIDLHTAGIPVLVNLQGARDMGIGDDPALKLLVQVPMKKKGE
jgi:hypothetical protein